MSPLGRARLALLAGLLAALPRPAEAALTRAMLDGIAVEARTGAPLPLAEAFRDQSGARRTLGDALGGRPALLIFADFTCRTLCGPILDFAAAALEQSGLKPEAEYRLVVIGLDPKDGPADARAMLAAHLDGSPVAPAAVMLGGDEAATGAVTRAAGYRAVYDAEHDQFAHPAAAFVITPAGRIARVLSPLGLTGNDVRLAMVEAGAGRIGTFADRLRLLCYGFDAAHGLYTAAVERWLLAACLLTLAALVGWIVRMLRIAARRAA